jgi:hypothetical protein
MAEDLTRDPSGPPSQPQLPPATEPVAPPAKERRGLLPQLTPRQRGRYGFRFMLAYVVLGLLLAGAAVGFGLLMVTETGSESGGGGGGDGWSDWKPTATGEAGVDQIASFVSERYRLPSGRQLVAVVADEPLVQNQIPVSTVAIEEGSKDAEGNPNYTVHDTGGDYMYVLCGLGQNCAIPEGTASVERHRLLRREALELALYTFRYLSGVDSIIAFLPPRRGQQPSSLLYFRKGDFNDHLSRPLRETLKGEKPPPMDQIPETERRVIDQLTTKNLFKYEFTQAPDASAILVLTPQFPTS